MRSVAPIMKLNGLLLAESRLCVMANSVLSKRPRTVDSSALLTGVSVCFRIHQSSIEPIPDRILGIRQKQGAPQRPLFIRWVNSMTHAA